METDYKTQLTQELEVSNYLKNRFKPVSATAKEGEYKARPIFIKRVNEEPEEGSRFAFLEDATIAFKVQEAFSPSKGRNGRGFYCIIYKILD